MAEIDIGPLTQRLADDEVKELLARLEKHGAPRLPGADPDDAQSISDAVDDDALVEFLDRLEAHEIACEIYLPVDFESRVEIGDLRVGSTQVLLDILDELKDELAADDEDRDEDDEDPDDEDSLLDAKLRLIWKLFKDGATLSLERNLPLHIT